MKVAITQALRPLYKSETQPHTIPPGIIPTEYKAEITLEVEGSKCELKIKGS